MVSNNWLKGINTPRQYMHLSTCVLYAVMLTSYTVYDEVGETSNRTVTLANLQLNSLTVMVLQCTVTVTFCVTVTEVQRQNVSTKMSPQTTMTRALYSSRSPSLCVCARVCARITAHLC